ncbi:MAG: hypothetical protein AAF415_20850 [Pseudomonadota bacterium]
MDDRFDLQDLDFDAAYRIAKQRAGHERSAAIRALFADIATSVRGLVSRAGTTQHN